MGKDSTLLITIFSPLELSPCQQDGKEHQFSYLALSNVKRLLRPALACSACKGSARGWQASGQPPSQPTPTGDTPRPPTARAGSCCGRGEGWEPRAGEGGFPSSDLILLGSNTGQR